MLLTRAVKVAREMGIRKVFLHAQVDVQTFYEKQNFHTDGKMFLEAGKMHIRTWNATFNCDSLNCRPDEGGATVIWRWIETIRRYFFTGKRLVPRLIRPTFY